MAKWANASLFKLHARGNDWTRIIMSVHNCQREQHTSMQWHGSDARQTHPENIDRGVGDGTRRQVLQQVARLQATKLHVRVPGGPNGSEFAQ